MDTIIQKLRMLSIDEALNMAFNVLEVIFIISLCFFHGKVIFIGTIHNSPSDFLTYQIYPADIFAIFLIIGAFIKNYCLGKPKITNFGLLAFILLLEIVISVIPRGTFISAYNVLRFIECIGLFIYFFHVELKHYIYSAFSFLGVIESIIGIIQFHLKHSIGLHFFGEPIMNVFTNGIAKIDLTNGLKVIRAYGTFSHPNSLAAFLLIAFAATSYLIFKDKRTIYYINLFLILIGVTVTFSRAAFVGLIIFILGTLITLLILKVRSRKQLRYYVLAVFIGIIVAIASYGTYLGTRATITDGSTYARLQYDKEGVEIASEKPIFGGGLGSVIYKVSNFLPENAPSWMIQPPHNYFIIVLDETGIVGLILFLVLLIYILNLYLQNFRKIKSVSNPTEIIILFWLFLSLLAIMQFDHYFYDIPLMALLLWTILGIICGTAKRNYAAIN